MGVDLLDDGVRESRPGLSFVCFWRELAVFALKRTSLGFRLRSSVFRREFAEFSKA